jgi:hypothetical protein
MNQRIEIENYEKELLSQESFTVNPILLRSHFINKLGPRSPRPTVKDLYNLMHIITQNFCIYLIALYKFVKNRASLKCLSVESVDRLGEQYIDRYIGREPNVVDTILRPILIRQNYRYLFRYLYSKNRIYPMLHVYINAFILYKLEKLINNISSNDDLEIKYKLFKSFFSKYRNYESIYLYCGYNITNMILCSVLNKYAKIIEIQHGYFDRLGGSYHLCTPALFRFNPKDFFAKEFWAFNTISKDYLKLENSMLKDSAIKVKGFPILQQNEVAVEVNKKILLLLPYDYDLKENLISKLVNNFKSNYNYEVFLRFHPVFWGITLPASYAGVESDKYDFDDWENSLNKYFNLCGFCSNALLEGEENGNQIYLIKSENEICHDFLQSYSEVQ